jgi:alternate signal-mediated exported protein
MNKMVKGSVVGASGVALLLGGFGTYALWSDSDSVAGVTVTSGELDVSAGTATWSDISTTGPNLWSATTDKIVPGDTIKMTQVFTVKATGKNMKGTLTFTPGTASTTAFGSNLTITPAVTASAGLTVVTPGTAWKFDAPLGSSETVTATVTYTFSSATTAQQAQNAAATMAASTFNLAQVRS